MKKAQSGNRENKVSYTKTVDTSRFLKRKIKFFQEIVLTKCELKQKHLKTHNNLQRSSKCSGKQRMLI